MGMFIGIDAVYLIIGSHKRPAFSLFYCGLKAGEIDFPQSSLIYHRVHRHPPQLLAVYCKVLGAGSDSLALHSADKGSRHFSGKIGILGKIFKIPAAERISLDI